MFISVQVAIFAQLIHDMNMRANYFIVIEYLDPSFSMKKALRCTEPYPRISTVWLLVKVWQSAPCTVAEAMWRPYGP